MSSTEEWPDPVPRRRLQPFASFRYRDYRWLWAANVSYGLVRSSMLFPLCGWPWKRWMQARASWRLSR